MSLDATIQGGSSVANKANVDANFQLATTTNTNPVKAGFTVLAGQLNDGSAFGTVENIAIGVSEESRLSSGVDSIMFNDQFNYTAQDTSNYRNPATTQTITYPGGYCILNGGNVTTINTNSAIQTYKSFPVFGGFGVWLGTACLHTAAPQVNAVTEWGLFNATLPGAAIPSDGAYFRFTNTGTFVCIINNNGTETTSSALTIPAVNINHLYDIKITEETVVFEVDGTVVFDVDTPAGFGQPFANGSLPFCARHYIAGSAPASAMQFKIATIDILLQDMNTTKQWNHVMASYGRHAYQGQTGGVMGSTALYTNSLAVGAGAAATNTTAALGTGFGGQFALQPTLTAGTDGIISSYQNPAGSVSQTPKTILITGIKIDAICASAITGGPLVFFMSLAFGHTAVSLVTAEAATTKAPRRKALGYFSFVVTTPIFATASPIIIHWDTPIPVYPGEFVQVVAKNIGTVSSAGVISFLIDFDAYNE
jgi:hypothetical protein